MDKLKDFISGKKFVNIVAIVLFLVAIVIFIVPMFSSGDYESQFNDNKNKIAELQQQLDSLQNKSTADEVTPEIVSSNLYSAADIGNTVASLQNKYRSISSNIDLKADADGRANAIKANADELRKYFTDGLDAQTPWFGSTQPYEWTFVTTYSITDSQIPCLFLCYKDMKNPVDLLAYVQATYDAKAKKFISCDREMTNIGNAYLSKEVMDENGNIIIRDDNTVPEETISPQLQDAIDQAKKKEG